MSTLRGEAALDFIFGDKWRELNAKTEREDKMRASLLKTPCCQPGCHSLACVTITVVRVDILVCRSCADMLAPVEECPDTESAG